MEAPVLLQAAKRDSPAIALMGSNTAGVSNT